MVTKNSTLKPFLYLTFNQTCIRIKYLLFKHIKYSERFEFEFL